MTTGKVPMLGWDAHNRRHFLRNAVGFTLALPLLSSLLTPAQARAAGRARRFIYLHNGHGTFQSHWMPDLARLSFSDIAPGDPKQGRMAQLAAIPSQISPVLGPEFNPFRAKMNLLRRIDYASDTPNHDSEAVLLGGTVGEAGSAASSIDHVIAKYLTRVRGGTVSPTVISNGYDKHAASTRLGTVVTGVQDPRALFTQFFGVSASGSGASAGSGGAETQATELRGKVVDQVFGQYAELMKNPRLSALDRQRLEEHMSLLSELQGRLYGTGGGGGSATPVPVPASCAAVVNPALAAQSPDPADAGAFARNLTDFLDILVLAARCGKSQIFTVMMHPYDHANDFGILNQAFGTPLDANCHNTLGHGEDKAGNLKMHRFFARKVARVLQGLDAVEDSEGGGTYLDSSLVLWGNDMGWQTESPGDHAKTNLPLMMAGSAGGFLKTGYLFDYAVGKRESTAPWESVGRPLNQVLITIMQAMGLEPADYETPGQRGFGPYGSRTADFEGKAGITDHKTAILPGMKA